MTLESGGKTNFLMKTARHCITQKIAKETCYCIWQNFGYYWENPSNFQIISPIFCDAFYLQENLEKNCHHQANCVLHPRQLQEFMRESEIVSNFSIILIDFIWLRVRTFISRLLRYSGPNFLIIIANRNPHKQAINAIAFPKPYFTKRPIFVKLKNAFTKQQFCSSFEVSKKNPFLSKMKPQNSANDHWKLWALRTPNKLKPYPILTTT